MALVILGLLVLAVVLQCDEQVDVLREQFGIYAIGTGRICLAALNSRNIGYVADSIAKVLQGR